MTVFRRCLLWCDVPSMNRWRCISSASLNWRPKYPSHIPTSRIHKMVLSLGASVAAISDPRRATAVGVLGETTSDMFGSISKLRRTMEEDSTGRRILTERPRIKWRNLEELGNLHTLPVGTLGRGYADYMSFYGFNPDERSTVRFVDSEVDAYVMQRYREIHDFTHVLMGLPNASVLAEIAIKWIEWQQTGLPMCAVSSIFGPLRLSSVEQYKLLTVLLPWIVSCISSMSKNGTSLICIYFEEHLEENLIDLRRRLGVLQAPRPKDFMPQRHWHLIPTPI